MLGVEHVALVHPVEERRLVWLEQIALESARQEGVVEPEEDVALRIPRGEERLGHELARVARLEDLELEAARRLELPPDVVRDHERVVRDEDDFGRRVAAAAAAGHAHEEHGPKSGLATDCCKRSHVSPPGRTARRTPRFTVMVADSPTKTFETPRLEPGWSVSPSSAKASPSVRTPSAGPCNAKSESSSPPSPVSVRVAADDVRSRGPDVRIELDPRVARRGEKQEQREQVIEPVADPGEDDDPSRTKLHGRVERELEIGGVLVGRVALDASSRGLRSCDRLGCSRVEVADSERDGEA